MILPKWFSRCARPLAAFALATRLTVLLAVLAPAASAATVTTPDTPELCELALSGPIVPGDAELLRAAVKGLIADAPVSGQPLRLCLDSPGGSLAEGARLAQLVRDWGLATRVGAEARCLSACAWVFMLGTTDQVWGPEAGEYRYIDRAIAPTAQLGFHAPGLDLGPAPNVATEAAQQGYRALIAAFAEILALAYDPGAIPPALIPADLIEQAMRTPPDPDRFFFIDTVDRAGRWRIRISDLTVSPQLDEVQAGQVCLNTTAWAVATAAERYGGAATPSEVGWDAETGRITVTGPLDGLLEHRCTIAPDVTTSDPELESESAKGSFATGCFRDGYTGRDACFGVDILAAYAPELALADLPTGPPPVPVAPVAPTPPPEPTGRTACWFPDADARVVNVQNFVNLRARPTLEAEALSQIPRGASVTIVEMDQVYHPPGAFRAARCAEVCLQSVYGAPDPYTALELDDCLAYNSLWAKIRGPDGQEGYVSVRFLK